MRWETIKVTKKEIQSVLWSEDQELQMKGENLLFTGAKAYNRGGGWWRICGYAQDGRDVERVLRILKD